MTGAPGHRSLRAHEVGEVIAASCWTPSTGAERIGLELEALPVRTAADGEPAGRVPLAETAALLDRALGAAPGPPSSLPGWVLPDETRVTLEPGGQIELSTPPRERAADALDDLAAGTAVIEAHLTEVDAVLAAVGADVWHRLEDVPPQLGLPRYLAMHDVLAARAGTPHGPGGVMMRQSCSLQVNLDLGPPGVAEERWLVAQLAAPLITGTFACSPSTTATNARAAAWQTLDPTRTGFPAALVDDVRCDPVGALAQAALDADVLLHRCGDGAICGRPGTTFADWLAGRACVAWPPTVDDLRYHLTTLWPEVRTRGFLEIRGIDTLPARWRAVPVVLLCGLLLDDRARSAALGVLERTAPALPQRWARAARSGVAEPDLCAAAVEVWSFALEGAGRLPDGFLRAADLRATEAYLDRFTLRGRCPSVELREHLAASPAEALAWAAGAIDTLSNA